MSEESKLIIGGIISVLVATVPVVLKSIIDKRNENSSSMGGLDTLNKLIFIFSAFSMVFCFHVRSNFWRLFQAISFSWEAYFNAFHVISIFLIIYLLVIIIKEKFKNWLTILALIFSVVTFGVSSIDLFDIPRYGSGY